MTRIRHRIQAGFTLIELVIVIVAIGILSGIAVPFYLDYRTQARTQALTTTAAAISAAASNNYTLRKNGGGVAVTSCAAAAALASYDADMTISGSAALTSGVQGSCTLNYTGAAASQAVTFSVIGA